MPFPQGICRIFEREVSGRVDDSLVRKNFICRTLG